MDGSGFNENKLNKMTSYQYYDDLNNYFQKLKFEKIKNYDELYAYLEQLQNEKLWMPPGIRSPYWPIGSTRMV